jgi:hypothetical protein
MTAKRTALAALRQCQDALRRGAVSELPAMLAEVVQALEHRPHTRERVAHVERLERQLAHLPAGERAAAIQTRMGLSKATYYRLRRASVLVSPQSETGRLSNPL